MHKTVNSLTQSNAVSKTFHFKRSVSCCFLNWTSSKASLFPWAGNFTLIA